jgi:hypothetical protein
MTFNFGNLSILSGKMLKPNDSDGKLSTFSVPLVQANPLNSIASIKFQKQLTTNDDDEPAVKSLFELHQNGEKMKKSAEDFKAKAQSGIKKPLFNFGQATSTFVLKPFFPSQASVAPLFKVPTHQDEDHEDACPNEADNEEQKEAKAVVASSNTLFEKIFQRQISKLKIVKGLPLSKKDNGFLSIERPNSITSSAHCFVVYRNFLGATQFSGVITPGISKIKNLNDKPGKHRVKVALSYKDASGSKEVHIELKFITESEKDTFISVFESLLADKQGQQ